MEKFTDVNDMRRWPQLKILDTDRFYNDSPNTGEPGCTCSRCYKQIKEGEEILRVAVDKELLHSKDDLGKDQVFIDDTVNGTEYRLCAKCLTDAKKEMTRKK